MPFSQELQNEVTKSQDTFVWEVQSWEHYERGSRWYIGMLVVSVGLVLYAVLTANFLFAFIILLVAFLLIITAHHKPHNILIQIGPNGVVMDGQLYEYKGISNFSIIYHPPETKLLYLDCKNLLRPRLRIPLEDQNPVAIRAFLKDYADENLLLQEEHLSDILARLLKI